MAENTEISWADDTFNPFIGCTKVSPACDGCYAENLMATRYGRVQWGAPGQGNGTRIRTSASNWAKPLKWEKEQAAKVKAWREGPSFPQVLPIAREPSGLRPERFVFCASLADVFDNAVPVEWRRDLFDLIRKTPHLTWLLLTKRPGNIVLQYRAIARSAGWDCPDGRDGDPEADARVREPWPRNAFVGTSIEDRKRLGFNAEALAHAQLTLGIPLTFWSCEPLLEDLGDISKHLAHEHGPRWIITGGETDQGKHRARPSHPDWFRSLRDQCAAAAAPFHFKQWGEFFPHSTKPGGDLGADMRAGRAVFVQGDGREPDGHFRKGDRIMGRVGKKAAGRLLDGVEHNARPVVRHGR